MYNYFKEWVESVIGTSYLYSSGQWVESLMSAEDKYIVIVSNGGQPNGDTRYLRYKVIFVGRRNNRQDVLPMMKDADKLVISCEGELRPCGSANVKPIGEINGPGFTTEDRAWCSVDFEVIL